MATLTTAGIHTLSLTDGTTYTVEIRIDEAALAEALGRKALNNTTGVAKEVGGLVEVRTVDARAARAAITASVEAGRAWSHRRTVWEQTYRDEHGLGEQQPWRMVPADRRALDAAEEAWVAANPKPARVTYR